MDMRHRSDDVLHRLGRVITVIAVETAGTRITALWIVLDPARFRAWQRPCAMYQQYMVAHAGSRQR